MTFKVSLVGLYLERFDLDIGIDFKNTKSHESNGVDVTHITSAVWQVMASTTTQWQTTVNVLQTNNKHLTT